MGQVETKVLKTAPPWDMEEALRLTDLDEATVDVCWKMWASNPHVHKSRIKEEDFAAVLGIKNENKEDKEDKDKNSPSEQAKRLFELLDRDDDERIEFVDTLMFMFSMDKELSKEQKLRRSFHLYDRTNSGKITKKEMVEALDLIGLDKMEHDDDGKVIIPDEVENLFELMDFDDDGQIEEADFLKVTMHYRNLRKLLTIDLLEEYRQHAQEKVREFEEQLKRGKDQGSSGGGEESD